MDLSNTTRNQHYLPQVEQRLNAANPDASIKRQRIYSFEVTDRERLSLRLENPNGRPISSTLAFQDLFSFDVASNDTSRLNFEALFERYERRIYEISQRLYQNIRADFSTLRETVIIVSESPFYGDIVDLFTFKILNFARNPHSITKALNTFGGLATYYPTSPKHLSYFERIIEGQRPHQRWLCQELGVSEQDYITWLKAIFMLFVEVDAEGTDFLTSMVRGLFQDEKSIVGVMVATYDDPICLVSDRAVTTNISQHGVEGFDFNVCSRAFVRYIFGKVDAMVPHAPQHLLEGFKRPSKQIHFHHRHNDLVVLGSFNRNVVFQSHRRVYSAIKSPVIPPEPEKVPGFEQFSP